MMLINNLHCKRAINCKSEHSLLNIKIFIKPLGITFLFTRVMIKIRNYITNKIYRYLSLTARISTLADIPKKALSFSRIFTFIRIANSKEHLISLLRPVKLTKSKYTCPGAAVVLIDKYNAGLSCRVHRAGAETAVTASTGGGNKENFFLDIAIEE